MYWRAKYIVVDEGALEIPMIFSDLQTHADVARSVGLPVVGAGFCHVAIVDGRSLYKCYGESVSLGIKSRAEIDAKVLNKFLGMVDGDDL